MSKVVQPSTRETAFNCPYCGAFTTQYWGDCLHVPITSDAPIPRIPRTGWREAMEADTIIPKETKEFIVELWSKIEVGEPFLHSLEKSKWSDWDLKNVFTSKCYNCKRIAVWVHDRLVFPTTRAGPLPNADLDANIRLDYEEARSIVNDSPRGAAALLRLCIQKLCVQLGQKSKDINDDIAALVKKGLNPVVQQSLDIVRVIGNEAVHPGVIDLNDDRDTADRLFELVNSIADQLITHPKMVSGLYERLPPGKREAIERRDRKEAKNGS